MTFTKDLALRSFISTYLFDLNDAPTHSFFDYHWVGGVTETSATIKIALQPSVANLGDDHWTCEVELTPSKSGKSEKYTRLL